VKHDRPGDWLWHEWDGDCYEPVGTPDVVYVTYGVVDPEDDLVRRALASALQRDGVADSLGDGYRIIDRATMCQGYAGNLTGETHRTMCDEDGFTEFGDTVEESSKVFATWAELSL
jgi:hypothetical protein